MGAPATATRAGLFPLDLRTDPDMPGASTLDLNLTVYTPTREVTGRATVSQALQDPVVAVSHVSGVFLYEAVMPPAESAIRIDLTGYPIILNPQDEDGQIPFHNFTAIIVLKTDWSEGTARYEYIDPNGVWQHVQQSIKAIG